MKFVSKAALGLVLALGAGSLVVATPAFAAKEKKPAAAAKKTWDLSKEFRAAAAPAEAAIAAKNFDGALALLPALEATVKTSDEKYILATYQYNVGVGKQDMKLQYQGASGMLTSGSAVESQMLELAKASGQLAFQQRDYRNAIIHFNDASNRGLTDPDSHIYLAESNFQLNQIPAGLAAANKAVDLQQKAGKPVPESWLQRVQSVVYKAKMSDEMGKWSRLSVKLNPTPQNWRNQMINYWDTVRDKSPAQNDPSKLDDNGTLDMWRLLRHNKSMGGEVDYREFAELALKKQAPGEAKALIEEGRAVKAVSATGLADYLAEAGRKLAADQASLAQEEKSVASMDGRRIANTASGFLSYGQDAKAIDLYRKALAKGVPDTNLVNMRVGIALARSGQKAEARKAFESVTGVRQGIAQFWLLWLDLNP